MNLKYGQDSTADISIHADKLSVVTHGCGQRILQSLDSPACFVCDKKNPTLAMLLTLEDYKHYLSLFTYRELDPDFQDENQVIFDKQVKTPREKKLRYRCRYHHTEKYHLRLDQIHRRDILPVPPNFPDNCCRKARSNKQTLTAADIEAKFPRITIDTEASNLASKDEPIAENHELILECESHEALEGTFTKAQLRNNWVRKPDDPYSSPCKECQIEAGAPLQSINMPAYIKQFTESDERITSHGCLLELVTPVEELAISPLGNRGHEFQVSVKKSARGIKSGTILTVNWKSFQQGGLSFPEQNTLYSWMHRFAVALTRLWGLNVQCEKTFPGLTGISGVLLRADLYFEKEDWRHILEIDGLQHATVTKQIHVKTEAEAEKSFRNIQRNDKIFNKYCSDNNISLERVPNYTKAGSYNNLGRTQQYDVAYRLIADIYRKINNNQEPPKVDMEKLLEILSAQTILDRVKFKVGDVFDKIFDIIDAVENENYNITAYCRCHHGHYFQVSWATIRNWLNSPTEAKDACYGCKAVGVLKPIKELCRRYHIRWVNYRHMLKTYLGSRFQPSSRPLMPMSHNVNMDFYGVRGHFSYLVETAYSLQWNETPLLSLEKRFAKESSLFHNVPWCDFPFEPPENSLQIQSLRDTYAKLCKNRFSLLYVDENESIVCRCQHEHVFAVSQAWLSKRKRESEASGLDGLLCYGCEGELLLRPLRGLCNKWGITWLNLQALERKFLGTLEQPCTQQLRQSSKGVLLEFVGVEPFTLTLLHIFKRKGNCLPAPSIGVRFAKESPLSGSSTDNRLTHSKVTKGT